MRIERCLIVSSPSIRMGMHKQTIIKPYLGLLRVFRRKPVNVAFDLALFRSCRAAFGFGVVSTVNFQDFSVGILYDIDAFYYIGITQPYFHAGRKTEIAL